MFEIPNDFIIYMDGFLLIVLLLCIYRGYKRGLLLQLMGLVTTLVSLLIAWIFSDVAAEIVPIVSYSASGLGNIDAFVANYASRLVWLVILFVIIRIALMVLTPIASFISKMPLIKQVNSFVGAGFGVFQFAVYMFLLVLFLGLPVVTNGRDIIEISKLSLIEEHVVSVIEVVDKKFNDDALIQSLIRNKGLSSTQKRDIVELLARNGFSGDEIREFLKSYE
jgi:uncharacterized membrane protein required for colicin V production